MGITPSHHGTVNSVMPAHIFSVSINRQRLLSSPTIPQESLPKRENKENPFNTDQSQPIILLWTRLGYLHTQHTFESNHFVPLCDTPEEKEDMCLTCGEAVTTSQNAVTCSGCQGWNHLRCGTNISWNRDNQGNLQLPSTTSDHANHTDLYWVKAAGK